MSDDATDYTCRCLLPYVGPDSATGADCGRMSIGTQTASGGQDGSMYAQVIKGAEFVVQEATGGRRVGIFDVDDRVTAVETASQKLQASLDRLDATTQDMFAQVLREVEDVASMSSSGLQDLAQDVEAGRATEAIANEAARSALDGKLSASVTAVVQALQTGLQQAANANSAARSSLDGKLTSEIAAVAQELQQSIADAVDGLNSELKANYLKKTIIDATYATQTTVGGCTEEY